MRKTISALLMSTALMPTTAGIAAAQDKTVKIGALSDRFALYAGLGEPSSPLDESTCPLLKK
ncbi:hypothetical protein JQ621_09800 [Bradyrhizobium manausense]|jgi:branched-chain amino acid transport system substrate-binding protein|uniref:hypothetical protein n=1 Tax=Bradyrhizobium manausense TaxID=989370 RepID=UPI001BABE850|nr:hypothetical protein [Bradyrhizobium manausense]MBR1087756.1 hypothetical protein [Bradyrhizobium manausense]